MTAHATVPVWGKLAVTPSIVWMSERYSYVSEDVDGNQFIGRLPPMALVNLFVDYRDVAGKGLDIGLGGYNLTGEKFKFIQPYSSEHAPLPGMGTEVMLRLSYQYRI